MTVPAVNRSLRIVGLGPAGAILALRACHMGWSVEGFDPAAPDTATLPAWPATYGVFEPEVPAWADEYFEPATELSVVTEPGADRTLGFGYRMMDKTALRDAVEHLVAAGRLRIHPFSVSDACASDSSASDVATADCRGAIVDEGALWQIAVGYVFSDEDATSLRITDPTFMDWSASVEDPVGPPSFVYIQRVDAGWLIEETILASFDAPGGPQSTVFNELRRRLDRRLARKSGEQAWADVVEVLDEEIVAIPMGTIGPKEFDMNFGARGGFIHPATGYSVGTALNAADEVLSALARRRWPVIAGWLRTADIALARGLRRIGSALIARSSPETVREFFTAFFSLPVPDQLSYLSGRSGLRTARTMWRLRSRTGLSHPFLRPLFRHPVKFIRFGFFARPVR